MTAPDLTRITGLTPAASIARNTQTVASWIDLHGIPDVSLISVTPGDRSTAVLVGSAATVGAVADASDTTTKIARYEGGVALMASARIGGITACCSMSCER